jgi:hypothetical protein
MVLVAKRTAPPARPLGVKGSCDLWCKAFAYVSNANIKMQTDFPQHLICDYQTLPKAIGAAVVAGMQDLSSLLGMAPRQDGAKGRSLIRISARATPTIVLAPTLAEMHTSVQKLLQDSRLHLASCVKDSGNALGPRNLSSYPLSQLVVHIARCSPFIQWHARWPSGSRLRGGGGGGVPGWVVLPCFT